MLRFPLHWEGLTTNCLILQAESQAATLSPGMVCLEGCSLPRGLHDPSQSGWTIHRGTPPQHQCYGVLTVLPLKPVQFLCLYRYYIYIQIRLALSSAFCLREIYAYMCICTGICMHLNLLGLSRPNAGYLLGLSRPNAG